MCFVLYKLLGLLVGGIPILAVAGIAMALTFYRPNNKPFISMLEAGFKYFTQNKLYIWKKRMEKNKNNIKQQSISSDAEKIKMMSEGGLKLSGSRLRDLAWSLDVLDLSKKNTGS